MRNSLSVSGGWKEGEGEFVKQKSIKLRQHRENFIKQLDYALNISHYGVNGP